MHGLPIQKLHPDLLGGLGLNRPHWFRAVPIGGRTFVCLDGQTQRVVAEIWSIQHLSNPKVYSKSCAMMTLHCYNMDEAPVSLLQQMHRFIVLASCSVAVVSLLVSHATAGVHALIMAETFQLFLTRALY